MTPAAPHQPVIDGSTAAGVSTIAERAGYQADERALLSARGIDLPVELACRECGCTDSRACPQGCGWVQPDLCSVCATELDELADPLVVPTLGAVVLADPIGMAVSQTVPSEGHA